MGQRSKHPSLTVRELARLGGKARARSLSPERRSEIARLGGLTGGRGRRGAPDEDTLTPEIKARLVALAPTVSETWYLSPAFLQPKTRAHALALVDAIMKHGTLPQYQAAGALRRELEGK